MTFLTTKFRLKRNLTAKDFRSLDGLASVYGIRGLSIQDPMLAVDYDASRIHEAEVLAELRKRGLPVELEKPIPAGGFDYTGEFKDFAWPIQGLSPANLKAK